MNIRFIVAAIWGTLIGACTFAAGPIAWTSANPFIATIQIALTYLMMPGLIVAAGVGSLIPAAAGNALLHFGLCWLSFPLFLRFRRGKTPK
jgi:hypothetical protein